MELVESIACYSGTVYNKIKSLLTDEVKQTIIALVMNPSCASVINPVLLNELIDMDIFMYKGNELCPNTAIFFEEDMLSIKETVDELSVKIAEITKANAFGLEECAPDVKNFIGSIMVGQKLHGVLKERGVASTWQTKTGKYEKSKVDFNQSCQAYLSFGNDLQNKSVVHGEQFTCVTIGSGEKNFISYLYNARNTGTDVFYERMAQGLVDIIPMLITGRLQNKALEEAARAANINVDIISTCILKDDAEKYKTIIDRIGNQCADYYIYSIDRIQSLLVNTIAGKQGAPFENMMMNFWRYMRKTIAKKLYQNGFLTDDIPKNGSATIFYENCISYF